MHANRAKEITDNFDPVTDRTVRLLSAKSKIFETILSAAQEGRYGVVVQMDADIMEELVMYLCTDCGYSVSPTEDYYTSRISWA
jgi:hypothetical protein